MQLEICSVYDIKADRYGTPIFAESQLTAQRSFVDVVNNPDSPLNKHPEDYRLFTLGFFDDEDGNVESYVKPVLLCTAIEVLTPKVRDIFAESGVKLPDPGEKSETK